MLVNGCRQAFNLDRRGLDRTHDGKFAFDHIGGDGVFTDQHLQGGAQDFQLADIAGPVPFRQRADGVWGETLCRQPAPADACFRK